MSDNLRFGTALQTPNNLKTTGAGTYPASQTVTGATFSTIGVNVQTTNAISGVDLKPGDYLYSPVNVQVRKIKEYASDGSFNLDSAFTSDVASEPLRVIPGTTVSGYSLANVGASDVTVNGMAMTTSDPVFSASNEEGIGPVAYDALSSTILIATIGLP